MSDTQQKSTRCPIPDCTEALIYHEILGIQAASNPLVAQITKNVYECPKHGLFAYLGDSKFRRIES